MIHRINFWMCAAISGLLSAIFTGSAFASDPDSVRSIPIGRFKPEHALVAVLREVDGVPIYIEPGFVVAADERRAYVSARMIRKSDPSTVKTERYIAWVGSHPKPRRVPLEKLVEYGPNHDVIFAAPKDDLPPPIPLRPFPEIREREELFHYNMQIDNDTARRSSWYDRRYTVQVLKINVDGLGRASGFKIAFPPNNLPALLLDRQGGIVAYYSGTTVFPTLKLKERTNTQLSALRMRTLQVGDETVVDFVMQTLDPFSSDLVPQIFVAQAPKTDDNKPEENRTKDRFELLDGRWNKPADGSVVELRRIESADREFEVPSAPSEWCRANIWTGSYRFRTAEKAPLIRYRCALIDKAGKVDGFLDNESRLNVTANASQPLLFLHPVPQDDQGKPITKSP